MLLTLSPPGTRLDIHGDETVAVGGVHVQFSCVCILRRLEERAAGQDQIRMLARGDTYSDQATLHHYYQVHQIRSYD